MRTWVLAAAMAALMAGGADASEFAIARAQALSEQLQDDAQCEAALPAAREFWRTSDFADMPADAKSGLLQQIVRCAWPLQDYQVAIAASREARTLGADWSDYALLQLALHMDDDALAVESFEALAASAPDTVATMPARFVWGVLSAADKVGGDGAAALRVHEALAAADYVFPDGSPDDSLRVAHARLLAARGEVARGRQRLEGVVDPRQLLIIRVDRRFDALRGDADLERRLDVAAGAEAALARAQRAAAAEPARLGLVLAEAQALRALARNDEALALLERHIAAAQATPRNYEDVSAYLNWLLNERAYTLYDTNHAAEAREAFGQSIAAGESGEWNASQVINFSAMLVGEGRAADALQVVSTVGRTSPYGAMWVAATRACAAAQLGDAAVLNEAMTFLRAHADDNISAATRAFLCANDLDAAATAYVHRLRDERQRSDALVALQSYTRTPSPALPYDAVLRQRLEQVRARPEVRAAVEAVGRIEEVPLHGVQWGDA